MPGRGSQQLEDLATRVQCRTITGVFQGKPMIGRRQAGGRTVSFFAGSVMKVQRTGPSFLVPGIVLREAGVVGADELQQGFSTACFPACAAGGAFVQTVVLTRRFSHWLRCQ